MRRKKYILKFKRRREWMYYPTSVSNKETGTKHGPIPLDNIDIATER